ncbi:MAG TPA: rubrerythrin [Phycisphaerales bacterium]|nr:rubrerythrin [Phycisphaerales bacterium]
MAIPFNADEVFEMAEAIERNGAKFYRGAASRFPAVADVFGKLAAMEDEHERTFAKMRAQLKGQEAEPLVFDPDGEAQMYLRVMADGHVFDMNSDPAEKLGSLQTAEDAIRAGLAAERDSIAFYTGLKECVSQRAGQDKVTAIIREEFRHIVTLNQMLTELKQG